MIDGFHTAGFEFLSNFWELRPEHYVRLKNSETGVSLAYRTVEHAYQAAKTVQDSQRTHIQSARYAGMAKKMGSKKGYQGFRITLRPDWEQIKLEVMECLIRAKFRDPGLAARLVATGEESIQESNWWGDSTWGVVTARAGTPCEPYGENHLGRILMMIRGELR